MPGARFFFDAGSGAVLWAATPQDREVWGSPIEPARLPISAALRTELDGLITRYDTSVNWEYPPDPGPWREAECRDFNRAVRRALGRLRDELGPSWRIHDEFTDRHEDPDLDRYLTDPGGFARPDPTGDAPEFGTPKGRES